MVLVDRAAEDASSSDRRVERDDNGGVVLRWMLGQALVRAVPVEVGDVLVEDLPGVALVVDQYPVGAFVADGPYEPFDVAVRLRRPRRNLDHLDVLVGEDGVEPGGVLVVAIADQEPEAVDASAQAHHEVADLLGAPVPGGVRGDAEQVHPSCPDLHRDEHVQPAQQNGVDMEEVDRQQPFRLCTEEGTPLRVHAAGCRPEPGYGEDASDGAGPDMMAEADQLPLDPAVPPQRGFSSARRRTRSRTSPLTGGRPVRFG